MTARKSHRYLSGTAATVAPADDELELDEAEVWSANDVELKRPAHHHPRLARKPRWVKMDHLPRSMPVKIPEWPKINLGGADLVDEVDDDDDDERIPPHEYLARTRGPSHQGVGRRLKGRDLSRVRNAIWKQLGFED